MEVKYSLIPDFENYMVGTDGSLWKIVKEQKNDENYENVQLYNDGKIRNTTIHRLVAEAFIPNPDNLPEVNHINEVKYDNRVSNLEWTTRKGNINHGDRNEKVSKANSKPVLQYDMDGNLVKRYDSIKQAAEENGLCYVYLSECCRGKMKSFAGYLWRFEYRDDKKKKRKSRGVIQYDMDMNVVACWDSVYEVHLAKGYGLSNIRNCCNGKYKTSYGYIWRYKK